MTPMSILRAAIGLAVALGLTLVAPSPAHAVTISLNTSRTAAKPTVTVTFSGIAAGAATGTLVTLQRAPVGSSSWSTLKTGGRISATYTYSYTTYIAVGAYAYRTKVGNSYSPAKTVGGLYGRNVTVPAPGAPFTLSARLPQAWSRVVKAQVSSNGTSWTDRGKATSNAGLVGVRSYLPATGYVRFVAPSSGSLPAWVGPKGIVTIGTDPVIKRILEDTNSYRQSLGRGALKLHPSLNKVAGDWAYHMHQACDFRHNPSYTSGYPWGWRKAAENIAAGQTLLSVVQAWIDSIGHRTNILGDYTHIGIGYYEGNNCYGRYWVQNFAKY